MNTIFGFPTHALVTIGWIFTFGAVMGNEQPPQMDKAAMERAMRPIVYRVPAMDRVVVHSNLKYTNVNEPRLLMDVYVPPNLSPEERRPFVLLVHGGAPPGVPVKEMGAFKSWGRLIAAHGMIAVTFTHRLQWPLSKLDESAADVRAAIEFARANAAKFNVDADRMCIAAWSAGGPLLTVALKDESPSLRCQLAIYPLVDVRGLTTDSRDVLERFSLNTYLRQRAFVPLFIARAGNDAIPALNERLDRFTAAALAANAPITLVNHPSGVHGFDLENDDPRSREIIRGALEFLRSHLFEPARR